MFNTESRQIITESVVESADSVMEAADSVSENSLKGETTVSSLIGNNN